jgi:hypothetical protein
MEAKKMEDGKDYMTQQISGADRRRFNMSKEENWKLRVSNIYDCNAFMMLDKECEAKRLANVYR